MQVYELGYLILPSIPEDGIPSVTAKIKALIEKVGAKEIDGEEPMKTDLAYSMTKTVGASRYVVNDAYIGWTKFELDPSEALNLKASIEKVDEVLRFLLIKAPKESNFTFAKARALMEEKKAKEAKANEPEATKLENGVAEEAVVE